MVPVSAPRFDMTECNSEAEREFVEALHARAQAGDWGADSWHWPGRVMLSVCRIENNHVDRTLRVDFDGVTVAFGDDETHSFVTDLYTTRGATIVAGSPPNVLAAIAADWLEGEMKNWSIPSD